MEKALSGLRPRKGLIRKSGRVNVSSGFAELVKILDRTRAERL